MKTIRFLLLVMILAARGLSAGTWVVDQDPNHDTVYFRSTARLEFVQGKTSNIDGSFQFDPANTSSAISGKLRVDLRTLKTGIDMRDEHMREKHLQTDQFPFAYFELSGVKGLPAQIVAGTSYPDTVAGYFYIHGVSERLTQLWILWKTPVRTAQALFQCAPSSL